MRHAWTAFATHGDPGWPTHDTGLTRIFDVEPAVVDYPEQVSRDVWVDYPEVLDLS
jgi:para-nitrobenzyl esterase